MNSRAHRVPKVILQTIIQAFFPPGTDFELAVTPPPHWKISEFCTSLLCVFKNTVCPVTGLAQGDSVRVEIGQFNGMGVLPILWGNTAAKLEACLLPDSTITLPAFCDILNCSKDSETCLEVTFAKNSTVGVIQVPEGLVTIIKPVIACLWLATYQIRRNS